MERATIEEARELFGKNFIGLDELKPLFSAMGLVCDNTDMPKLGYSLSELQKYSTDYILLLGMSELYGTKLSIHTFRNSFGVIPEVSEPCFYNQDWYLNEDFIYKTLSNRWYLLKKNIIEESRAIQPTELLNQNVVFPSAVLCVYAFFAYYYVRHEVLWYCDFVWCDDTDHNGDRIYVGKYHDVDDVNKNGFSIHRHLSLRSCYGAISSFE